MSQGPVEIVNIALALLGKAPIHKFGQDPEDEPAARIGERIYTMSRDLMVSDFDWCAFRYTVALKEVSTPHPYGVRYKLPSDCVVPRVLLPRSSKPNTWYIEGREVIIPTEYSGAGGETPYLRYTRLTSDTRGFPPYFTYALAVQIAAIMCMPVTKDIKHADRLDAKAMQVTRSAQLQDATVGREDDQADQDPWNDSFNNPDLVGTMFNDG